MKKVVKAMLAVTALVSISTGASLAPAFADDLDVIARSVKGLASYQVFQSAGSTLTDGQTLATKLRGSDLGVVVIPQKEVTAKTAQDIASEVRSSSSVKYSTVIVVLDGSVDSFGVSSSTPEVEGKIEGYLGNDAVKDAGWILNQNAPKLKNVEADIKAEAAQKASDAENAAKTERDTAFFISWLPALVILAPLFAALFLALRRRRRTQDKGDTVRYGFRKMPKGLREAVGNFRKTSDLHKNLKRYSLYEDCSRLIARFIELEETMVKLPSNDQRRMILEVEYVERLEKLKEAIGKDYYLSIIEDPTHWEDPNKKLKRVKDAVIALREQILVSIKQINDSSNLEFKIALDSIIGDKNVKVEDLYKK